MLNARKDPQYFLDQFKGPVILDEIQFAPELLAYIKIKVDAAPGKGQYFWRTSGGGEVDLVLEQGNALYPIEIKAAGLLTKHDARGLRAFRETYAAGQKKIMPGIIVYAGKDCYWLDNEVLAVPWNMVMTS